MVKQLLGDNEFRDYLDGIGFSPIGAGWYEHKNKDIRIRLWVDRSVDIWRWSVMKSDRMIIYRGEIWDHEDIEWVLKRCFDNWRVKDKRQLFS